MHGVRLADNGTYEGSQSNNGSGRGQLHDESTQSGVVDEGRRGEVEVDALPTSGLPCI